MLTLIALIYNVTLSSPLHPPPCIQAGHIQLFDLPSSSLLEDIPAHSGAVWGLALAPDKRFVVSCSADKTVKFWEFELVQPSTEGGEDTGRR